MKSFWKVINREELERQYNVKETAEADAKFNIPDENAKTLTNCENDIVGQGEEYLQINQDIGKTVAVSHVIGFVDNRCQ